MAFANPPFAQLVGIAHDHRDSEWEAQFLREFPKEHVSVVMPEPQRGPDGWPYLYVSTNEGVKSDESEPVVDVITWLSTRGLGLVVNPQKGIPDFVFTYGMLWNFQERRQFLSPAGEIKTGEFLLKPQSKVLTGPPSESYLPQYARVIIKQFLADQGVFTPKVLLISEDKKQYDLCFSIESLGAPESHEHMGIAEAISWFLPAHYSVALVSEKTVDGFAPL